ncbi:cyclic nucleotide-binding domain-containing protein [Sphingobacterium sp. DK4209]|uniref:Cyclic nucleotide-binding domain-containing protein n=1 Tax=Sphingobacterium zhuxiongii TaxID=2662364 RepID=A0A5Q0QDK1_9SPHI|nr:MULTISPECIES: Crp/Fnr family transcriptional regulator [unclassified Sphingobacterium]MVZ64663.1 cyclic nucleotide-binding domain-containing protein [Sphingobacterium sp. DK4209]QGA27001.1 cyclic nucleotide-binding domain-containing protein [Sphingobacterium sp. dk4302]
MIPIELLLDKGAVTKQVDSGQIIYYENSACNYYYQIISGRVRLSNFMIDGREVLHKVVCANDGFGEVAIFDEGLHGITAVADCQTTLIKISKDSFREILKEYHSFYQYFAQKIAKDLHFKQFLTSLVCNFGPEEILSKLIHKLNENTNLICHECHRLMLTRQQLANMTGLRVETIIRTMKQMEKKDKLQIVKGKVYIPADGIG